MKFKFKIQDFQTEAVEATVQVFAGQPKVEGFSYIRDLGIKKKDAKGSFLTMTPTESEKLGYKNEELRISNDHILKNVRQLQRDNNIKEAASLKLSQGSPAFDIEMETGTGKTYVYIKTMFELNKLYGWTKFIVVVPSIAIREGVQKSFDMTEEHFMELYGKKIRSFIYNSSDLNAIDQFSSSADIYAMIINTQAFNTSLKEGGRSKEARIIYSERDDFASRRPIDVIAANNPILILDEPQKMGGAATQAALKNFNPLFSLNYSATHRKQNNLIYVLDALDAYNKKLVKRIEVKGFEVKNFRGTDGYLYLDEIIISPDKPPKARIFFEINYKNSIKREARLLKVSDDLFYLSNNMQQYEGFKITEINPLNDTVTFLNGEVLGKGTVVGDIAEKDMRRIQIRETIKSHLEKEASLYEQGIKTLSLFFIDEVAKYRQYDEDGEEVLGEYGQIFEEEYNSLIDTYRDLFNQEYFKYLDSIDVSETHNGYFSIDKAGKAIDSAIKRGQDFSDDISAYELILKNKERLLSFTEPTRFIFSHSALREGWDNPNVFQICTLKQSESQVAKRQEVGRGLRLCVNKLGDRMDLDCLGEQVHEMNLLTVIASDSYSDFVKDLQKDIKENLYDRPVKAEKEYFVGKIVTTAEGTERKISAKEAEDIVFYLIQERYIDRDKKVTEKYRNDLANKKLAALPDDLQEMEEGIHCLVQSIYDEKILDEMFLDGHETKVPENQLNDNFYKQEFQSLWKMISNKYAYKVNFDSKELIAKAIKAIDENLQISKLQYTVSKGIQHENVDVHALERQEAFAVTETQTQVLEHSAISTVKYDLIGKLSEETLLSRKTVAVILSGISEKIFSLFKDNPEEFISKVARLINSEKATMLIKHLSYNKTDETYDSSVFTAGNSKRSIKDAIEAKKHVQDYIFVDGISENSIEAKFAKETDTADEVVVYAKLPRGFKIPTPVGNYTPDWAIAFKEGQNLSHIYFIAETKGTLDSLEIRAIESAKIECAKILFNKISSSELKCDQVKNYQSMMNILRGSRE